ncbi:MAG TPA: DUF2333 family protein [Rhodospirillales bacterium]|jgi:hypothetical protein|nr:DUF2333 family protein [Rhodospirillales bacterium]
MVADDDLDLVGDGRSRVRRLLPRILLALVVLLLVYYLGGAWWIHKIDDDPAFTPPQPTAGGSYAVDMAAALIDREVNGHGWPANDPFFMPGSILDNMPNYQTGMIYALSRFAIELSDQLGRSRGSSSIDPDLDRAAGLLKYPGNIWIFDLSRSLAPTASSESQYRQARQALLAFNQRLAAKQATFDVRADNLIDTLERFNSDLGAMSGTIDEHLSQNTGWLLNFQVDDIFYQTKGRLYGYFMIISALGRDFQPVIDERNLGAVWNQMLASAEQAATQQPWVVLNGSPSSQFTPSHLANQGFLLLRLRTQLREISSVLQK